MQSPASAGRVKIARQFTGGKHTQHVPSPRGGRLRSDAPNSAEKTQGVQEGSHIGGRGERWYVIRLGFSRPLRGLRVARDPFPASFVPSGDIPGHFGSSLLINDESSQP
jgi:hypothetical protein